MTRRLALLVLCLAGCARSGRDAAGSLADSTVRARAVPAVAFRVPATGGPLSVYALPALEMTPWGAGSRVSGARSAVGVDIPGRRLLFRDSTGAVASFDLVALRQRTIAPRHAVATVAADGTLLAVDPSGGITESQPWGTRQWGGSLGRGVRDVFAAPGSRLIAVRRGRGSDTLQVAERESGIAGARPVPEAVSRAASRDGDAVAFATDSGLVVFENRELDRPWSVRLSGKPRAVVFSPSGHRLYVALREKSELAVVDRFTRRERAAISLPKPAATLRPDPWGRVLLVRGESDDAGGQTWVVSVPRNTVIGSLKGSWESDLPEVSESGVLLARQGSSVVARDIRSLDSLGAVAEGARDLWFAGRWVPASAAAAARANLKPTGTPEPRTAALTPSAGQKLAADGQRPTANGQPATGDAKHVPAAGAPSAVGRQPSVSGEPSAASKQPSAVSLPPSAAFYVQVIATRSEDAARSLAAQLADHRALVVPPRPGMGDDNWRVMAGPFRSRDAADSAGREMGRPYWIVDRSREVTKP